MEKKIKVAKPVISNFISLERNTSIQQGVQQLQLHITELSEQECLEYAEILKNSFIEQWQSLTQAQTIEK
mgnify:FL=1|tara:strand:- start:4175 stop:4384 length:210 start_codon:yes stop_codon:yes gene_type:complete